MSAAPLDEHAADWVDDRMSAPEREAYEQELAADPALRAQAEDYSATVQLIRGALRAPAHAPPDLVASVLAEVDAGRRSRGWWFGLSGLAAAAVLGWLLFPTTDPPSPAATPAVALAAAPERDDAAPAEHATVLDSASALRPVLVVGPPAGEAAEGKARGLRAQRARREPAPTTAAGDAVQVVLGGASPLPPDALAGALFETAGRGRETFYPASGDQLYPIAPLIREGEDVQATMERLRTLFAAQGRTVELLWFAPAAGWERLQPLADASSGLILLRSTDK